MSRSTPFLVVCALAALVFAGCGASTARKTLSRSLDLDGGDAASLRIESSNGSVRIVEDPTAEGVVVLGSVTAGGRSDAEAKRRLDEFDLKIERTGGDTWSISSVMPTRLRSRDSVGLMVTVPRIGDASVTTRNGSIAVPTSHGDLELEAGNGSIKIEGAHGRVVGRTGNGSIACRLVNPDFAEDVELRTVNGRIRLQLPSNCVGLLSADTSNGDIDHEGFERMKVTQPISESVTVVGDGPASIVIATGNGSVRIVGQVAADSDA